jgi:thiosulfate dehydrogenase [quinone] large subunit
MAALVNRKGAVVQDPPLARFLFSDPRAGWFWLIVRLWVGWQWLDAALHKLSNPAWVQTGEAVQGFWSKAVLIPETGKPAIAFDWYRNFLQTLLDVEAYRWLGPVIAYSEFLVGLTLILGIFTGIAAFGGALMNWNFMMAGSASTNPVLFLLAVGLMLAWKVAGSIGADSFLLAWLGTPWQNQESVATAAPKPGEAYGD